jgi:FMN-dependent NADH-azoreductase
MTRTSTLLRVDASLHADAVSRQLSSRFAERWQSTHEPATVVHRDLGVEPLPHVTQLEADHFLYRPGCFADDKPEGVVRCEQIIDELRSADLLLLAMPMHNFTVPSTVKAWLDHIAWPDYAFDAEDGHGLIEVPAVVILARGGGYGPDAPKADWNFQEPYLRKVLEFIGITDVEFIAAELTAYSGDDSPDAKLGALAEQSLNAAIARVDELSASLAPEPRVAQGTA